jgi:hypothetical protein
MLGLDQLYPFCVELGDDVSKQLFTCSAGAGIRGAALQFFEPEGIIVRDVFIAQRIKQIAHESIAVVGREAKDFVFQSQGDVGHGNALMQLLLAVISGAWAGLAQPTCREALLNS